MKSYSEKLRDPRWQRRRLEIMHLADFKCERCGDGSMPLNVHHVVYRSGADPWDYSEDDLTCLCEPCHELEHRMIDEMRRIIRMSDDPENLVETMAEYAERGQIPQLSHVAINQLREFIAEDDETRVKRQLQELKEEKLSDDVRLRVRMLMRELNDIKYRKS